jgi:hypothetical protein
MQRTGKNSRWCKLWGWGEISAMSFGQINMKMGRVKGGKCKRTRKKGKEKGRKGKKKRKWEVKGGEMQNREVIRQKGHDKSRKMTCCISGKISFSDQNIDSCFNSTLVDLSSWLLFKMST